jgi:hypothetical protein
MVEAQRRASEEQENLEALDNDLKQVQDAVDARMEIEDKIRRNRAEEAKAVSKLSGKHLGTHNDASPDPKVQRVFKLKAARRELEAQHKQRNEELKIEKEGFLRKYKNGQEILNEKIPTSSRGGGSSKVS